jgi:hypothetical protein
MVRTNKVIRSSVCAREIQGGGGGKEGDKDKRGEGGEGGEGG